MNNKFIVRYIGASDAQVNWGGNDDPRKQLLLNSLYEVEEIDVRSSHTKIKLKDVKGWFNDVSFRYINKSPNRQELYHKHQNWQNG